MTRRVIVLILALSFPVGGTSVSGDIGNATEKESELKAQEYWIAEVLRLALEIRKAEEDYEKLSRECALLRKQDLAFPCDRARESLAVAERTRYKYQTLLNQASNSSIPVEWLKAHFTWVRWSPAWRRQQNQEAP
jgi:hypothetical protein